MRKYAAALALLLAAAGGAHAGEHATTEGGRGLVVTQAAEVLPHLEQDVGFFISYSQFRGQKADKLVSSETRMSVSTNLGLNDNIQLGLAAPVLINSGTEGETTLGRAALVGKFTLDPYYKGLGSNFGLTGHIKMPVTDERFGSGEPNFGAEVNSTIYLHPLNGEMGFHLAGGFRKEDRFTLKRQPNGLDKFYWDANPVGTGSFGASLRLPSVFKPLQMIAEVVGSSDRQALDEDLYGSLAVRIDEGLAAVLTAAVQFGLPDPKRANTDLRIVLGASVEWANTYIKVQDDKPIVFDTDGDGIPDNLDNCPDRPETVNEFRDDDGCPDMRIDEPVSEDFDNDGIPDDVDKCPERPETVNTFRDDDGCPDFFIEEPDVSDIDGDGIADVDDACPDRPETVNEFRDDDGCPDIYVKPASLQVNVRSDANDEAIIGGTVEVLTAGIIEKTDIDGIVLVELTREMHELIISAAGFKEIERNVDMSVGDKQVIDVYLIPDE